MRIIFLVLVLCSCDRVPDRCEQLAIRGVACDRVPPEYRAEVIQAATRGCIETARIDRDHLRKMQVMMRYRCGG